MSRFVGASFGALLICASIFILGPRFDTAAGAIQTFYEKHRPAQTKVITFDPGGGVLEFFTDYAHSRARGDRYVIDGMCISACTLITGLIPADRVCITPRASMGFHSAFTEDDEGKRKFSPEATGMLWRTYNPIIRTLLQQHGWSSPDTDQPTLVWIEYDELKSLYATCQ
jgi:hypothetical protein